mgnify:CR=1 FL=1
MTNLTTKRKSEISTILSQQSSINMDLFSNKYPYLAFLLENHDLLRNSRMENENINPDMDKAEKYAKGGYFVASGAVVAGVGLLLASTAMNFIPLLLLSIAVAGTGIIVANLLHKKAEKLVDNCPLSIDLLTRKQSVRSCSF